MFTTNMFDSWETVPVITLPNMDRQIYTGENVMLVRNSIHPNEVLAAHSHPHEQILLIESGECRVETEGRDEVVKSGGLVWFKSNQVHKVTNLLDNPLVAIDIFSPIREDFLK